MKWRGGRRSSNIEDQRGAGGGLGGGTGGGFGFPGGGGFRFPGGGMSGGRRAGGIGGIGIVVVFVLMLIFGIDPSVLLTGGAGPGSFETSGPVEETPESAEMKEFVSVVLADTEDTWHTLFQQMGDSYREPKLVLFSGGVQSGCGAASSAVGPFYCPADEKVYLDMDFFRELSQRFGAPGDFAQAYVIAHEIGHHVQTLLGISAQVRELQAKVSEAESNALSVRMELQADCLAGVWAHHADRSRQILESGDVEEALGAASAIGDDTLQREAQGHVVPDSFTHGTSAQRMRWFEIGLAQGSAEACDTFNTDQL
jgi:uncharacterized protein